MAPPTGKRKREDNDDEDDEELAQTPKDKTAITLHSSINSKQDKKKLEATKVKRQSLEPTPAEEQLLSPSTSKKSSTTASATGTSRGTTTKSTSAKTATSRTTLVLPAHLPMTRSPRSSCVRKLNTLLHHGYRALTVTNQQKHRSKI